MQDEIRRGGRGARDGAVFADAGIGLEGGIGGGAVEVGGEEIVGGGLGD